MTTFDAVRTIALHASPAAATSPAGLLAAARLQRRGHLLPLRYVDRVRMRLGRSLAHEWIGRVAEAVQALPVDRPHGPRFLVRLDEFPHAKSRDDPARFGVTLARGFHRILVEEGVPYLVALVPRPAHRALDPGATGTTPLDDDERALLAEMRDDGTRFGLHGLTHRTRDSSPRRRSELDGLSDVALNELLDEGERELAAHGIRADVFVPPFNRFTRRQYDILAQRFDVVCGGPETILRMGVMPTPAWVGRAVYAPAYPPLYGRAREILGYARELIARRVPTWVPVVVHPGNETGDGFAELRELAQELAPYAADWQDLLDTADAVRAFPAPGLAADASGVEAARVD